MSQMKKQRKINKGSKELKQLAALRKVRHEKAQANHELAQARFKEHNRSLHEQAITQYKQDCEEISHRDELKRMKEKEVAETHYK